jgi:hypothetical protein
MGEALPDLFGIAGTKTTWGFLKLTPTGIVWGVKAS